MQGIFDYWIGLSQLVNLNNQAIGILGYRLHLVSKSTKKADLFFFSRTALDSNFA